MAENMLPEESLWKRDTPKNDIKKYDESLDDSYKAPPSSDGIHFAGTDVPMPVFMRPPAPEPQQAGELMAGSQEPVKPTEIDEDMGFIEMAGKSFIVGVGDMVDSMGDIADFISGNSSSEVSKQVYGLDTSKPISDSLHNFADYLQSFGDDVPGLNDLEDVTWDDLSDPDFWATGVARMLPFALSLMVPATYAARGVQLATRGAKFARASQAIAKGAQSIGATRYATELAARGLIKSSLSITAAGATSNLIEGAALAGQTLNEGVKQGLTENEAMNAASLVYRDNLASMAADVVQYGLFMGQLGIGRSAMEGAKKLGAQFAGTSAAKSVMGVAGKAAQKTGAAALKAPGIKEPIKQAFKAIGMGAAQGITDGVVEQFQEVYQDWSVQRRIADEKGQDFPGYLDFFLADEQRPTRVLSFATSLLMSGASNTIRTASENRVALQRSIDNRNESHEYLSSFTKDLDSGNYTVKRKVKKTVKDKNGKDQIVEEEVTETLDATEATNLMKDSAAYNLAMNAVKEGDEKVVLDFLQQQLETGRITEEQHKIYTETISEVQQAMEGKPTHNLDNMGKTELVSNSWLYNTSKRRLEQQKEDIESQIATYEAAMEDGSLSKRVGNREIKGLRALAESSMQAQKDLMKATKDKITEIYDNAESREKTKKFVSEKAPKIKELIAKEKEGTELTEEEQAIIDEDELSKEFYKAEKEAQSVNDAYTKAEEKVGKKMKGHELDKAQSVDGKFVFIKEDKKDGSVSIITVNEDGTVEQQTDRIDEAIDEVDKEIKEQQEKEQKIEEETEEGKDEEVTEDDKEQTPEDKRKIKLPDYLKPSNIKASASLVKDATVKVLKAFFNKERAIKILDAVEAAAHRRKVRRAIKMGGGSDITLANLYAKKSADGLISIQFLDEIYEHGEEAAAYAMGLGVFVNPNAATEAPEEAIFHENFHIFRKLYGHLPEVKKMMRAVVKQPVYKITKLQYQEHILYAVPDGTGKVKYITQREGLEILKRIQQGSAQTSLFNVITTYEDYLYENKLAPSEEAQKSFYEYSKDILEQAGYQELKDSAQVNIQDEALSKLGGLYGSVNQDIFIKGQAKKTFNDAMSSWKNKIRGSVTEEEAASAFQVISKGLYDQSKTRKNQPTLEEQFSKINEVIRKNKAKYGNFTSSAEARRRILLKRKDVLKRAFDLLQANESSSMQIAENYAKNSFDSLVGNKEDLSDDELKAFIEDKLNLKSSVNIAYKDLVRKMLTGYRYNSPEYVITKEILLDRGKKIKSAIYNQHKQALRDKLIPKLQGAINKADKEDVQRLQDKFKKAEEIYGTHDENGAELSADDDAVFSMLLDENPRQISNRLRDAIEFHLRRESFTMDGEPISKDRLLTYLIDYVQQYKTKDDFIEAAWDLIELSEKAVVTEEEMHLSNFFAFLTQELDIIPFYSPLTSRGAGIAYGTILAGLYNQMNSMTIEKSILLTQDGHRNASSIQSMRRVTNLLEDVLMLDNEFSIPGKTSKTNLHMLSAWQYEGATHAWQQRAVDQYQKRMKYSQDIANIIWSDITNDTDLIQVINTYFLPLGSDGNNKVYSFNTKALDEYRVHDEKSGQNFTLREYFNKGRLKEMFWESISIQFPQGNEWKNRMSLEAAKNDAVLNVFGAVFRNRPAVIGGSKLNITREQLKELEDEFFNRLESAYNNTENFPLELERNVQYVEELSLEPTLTFVDKSIKLSEYLRNDNVTAYVEINPLSTDKQINELLEDLNVSSLDKALEMFGLDKKQLEAGKELIYRRVKKTWIKTNRSSMSMYPGRTPKEGQKALNHTVFNELRGHRDVAKAVIATYNAEHDKGYMSTIITQEGKSLNKTTRKYFLEYNKESLEEYLENDPDGFANLFNAGGITNPYAQAMADGAFTLDYRSLDGSEVTASDRDNILASEVTQSDINAIMTAMKSGGTYLQVVRDYSDKSRRYYVKVNVQAKHKSSYTNFLNKKIKKQKPEKYALYEDVKSKLNSITDEKEYNNQLQLLKNLKTEFITDWLKSNKAIQAQLDFVKDYHEAQTRQLIENHNSDSDFNLFDVASQEMIDYLVRKNNLFETPYEIKGYGKEKARGKGQMNLLSTKAFEQTIDGKIYDWTNVETHARMIAEMNMDEEAALASINYSINKFYIQDLHSFAGEEGSFNDKNKRATGFIAPHDSSYKGYRVEPIIFEDPVIGLEDQVQKVQVIDYETGKLKEVELTPKMADSASYITMEEANKILDTQGGLSDVKGSYKLVGFGRNIDNKRIASLSGSNSSQFYFKGHTIVLNNKVKGPLAGVYRVLKSREKFYEQMGLNDHRVIAYDGEAVKKGKITGVNTFTLDQFQDKEFDINLEMDKWSYDIANDIRGFDGRFIGVQNELDKEAVTSTVAKQGVSNISVFLDHWSAPVRQASMKVMKAYATALNAQFDQELEGVSFEDLAKQDLNASSMPIIQRVMFSEGKTALQVMRDRAIELANSKIKKKGFKLRTKGTLSLQESDIIQGHEFDGDKLIENDNTLKPLSVKEVDGEMVVEHAEAIISKHMARELNVKEGDLFVATRIPASSAGSTIVLKVKGVSPKPGNTIAVSAKTSEIIGSDLDGDMLHLNVLDKGKDLSLLQQAKNDIVQSIIDLYSMPETVNMLAQIIEFEKNIAEPTNQALFGDKKGSSDISNDFTILGAQQTFETSKGNVPMISNIAAQNLTYNYIAQGNPSLYFANEPITIKHNNKEYKNLSNKIEKDGTGTFYELCNYLNLVLDDGKYGNRAKFQFVKETASQFISLIKYGMKPADISVFLKNANFQQYANYTAQDLLEETDSAIRSLYSKKFNVKTTPALSTSELIGAVFSKEGRVVFDLSKIDGKSDETIIFYYATKQISQDVLDLSLFVGLDKKFSANPIGSLIEHRKAIEALERQEDISKNVATNHPVFVRHQAVNETLITKNLEESPELSNGYGAGIIGQGVIDSIDAGFTGEEKGVFNTEILKAEDMIDDTLISLYKQGPHEFADKIELNDKIIKSLYLSRVLLHSGYNVNDRMNYLFDKFNIDGGIPMSDFQTYGPIKKMHLLTSLVTNRIIEGVRKGEYEGSKWFGEDGILTYTSNLALMTNANGTPMPVNFYRTNLDLQKIQRDLEFPEQVELYRKSFEQLPTEVQEFLLLTDFINTGWGAKNSSKSMVPYMSKAMSKKVNGWFEKVQNPEVSTFEGDMKLIKENLKGVVSFTGIDSIDNRRIALLVNLGLNGADVNVRLDKASGQPRVSNPYNGLFKVKSKPLDGTGIHVESVVTYDGHERTTAYDNYRKPGFKDKFVFPKGKAIKYISSWPEASLIQTFAALTSGIASEEAYTTYEVTEQSNLTKDDKVNVYYGSNDNANLSNLAERPFKNAREDNRPYASVEHFYQTWKSGKENTDVYNRPDDFVGKKRKAPSSVDTKISSRVMKHAMLESFKQNPAHLNELIATGEATLTHTQEKGFWKTEFPKLLMEVREELKSSQSKKFLKIPSHGRRYYGDIGVPLKKDEYFRMVQEQLDRPLMAMDELSDEEKGELEGQYLAYVETVKVIADMYKDVREDFADSTYRLDHSKKHSSKKALDNKFKDIVFVYKELRETLSKINVVVGDNVMKGDPIAKASLLAFAQTQFGNHIAEKQIADWEYSQGKRFVEEISKPQSELRRKDIGALEQWMSPGDFGKSKPAMAYINKTMKTTHMKYTRNISLVTKEMNEKLDALYKDKFGDGMYSKGIKLWKKYMPFGSMSFDEILFGNFFSFDDKARKGIKKYIDLDGEVSYKDTSNLELKKSLFLVGKKYGNALLLNRKGNAYKALSKAEQDYLEMYVKFTNFYRDMIVARGLYEDGRGANYIPNIGSATWETYHRRGFYGMYHQLIKGDEELAKIIIEDINPITGEKEMLDYFSWKAIYMHAPGETFTIIRPQQVGRGIKMVERQQRSKQEMTGAERVKAFRVIRDKAQKLWDKQQDDAGNKINVDSAVTEMMKLEEEEAMNRHLHRRSMSSAYLATYNMHRALANYMRLMMFQHGNIYRDADNVYHHLSWAGDDNYEIVNPNTVDEFALAFTGFSDKMGEVDAAMVNLDASNKRAVEFLEKVVKGGLIKKEKNLTWTDSPFKILNQQPEKVVVNFFTQWTMYIALGLNFSAAAGNVLIGKYNSFRQAGAGALLRGEKRFWGLSSNGVYNNSEREKASKMISEFGILTYRAEEVAEGVGASSLSSLFFYPMVFAENWIQQAQFLGNLEQEQWDSYFVDKNGELKHKSEREGMSKTEELEWKRKAEDFKKRTGKNLKLTGDDIAILERRVIDVQGRGYSETDIRFIQLYSIGNMVMQFKRWFPTFLADRLKREDINDLGDMKIGSLIASKDFLIRMKNEGKISDPKKLKEELNKLPEHRRDAVLRAWRGTQGTMLAALLYALVLHGTDDDEWDDTEKLLEKLLGDTMLMVNVPKLVYMTNIPAMDTAENLGLALYHAAKGTEYQRKAKYGDKGDLKAMAHFARLMPASLRPVLQTGSAGKSRGALN